MKIRVVIADDHQTIRHGVRRILSRYEDIEVVGEAESGEEALRLVAELKPDVLLLDIEMPDIKGFEVTRRLNERNSKTRALALSAYSSRNYIRGMLDFGAAGYLTKEEVPQTLIMAIRSVADGDRNWLSPKATEIMGENY